MSDVQRLATLVQNLPDYAIFLVDPSGIVIEWTEGAQRVKGYTAEEILGQHFSLFYTPEDQAAGVPDQILAGAARTGRHESEGWRVRKGGDLFWGNQIATAVRDEAGTLVGFTKIARDLTERKQAEEALAESEERYRLIVEQATNYAIFGVDAERCIETWPAGAAAVYGWAADEAIGQLMDITYTPEDQTAGVPQQETALAQRDGQAPNVRWHVRKDGTRVFIEGMAYARRGADGTFQGVFKVGQDVTDRVLAEDARRADEARMREQLEADVADATLELRAISRRLLLVQEEERRNLALELHDEIGQVLTGLSFQLAAVDGQTREDALTAARETVQKLTEQVRQLSLDLRPAVLDQFGLLTAVAWHVERFQATSGITVKLRHEGPERRYAPEVEIAAFRVVQEALTNIARYAEVSEAWVALVSDGSLLVVIHDRGRGFNPAQVTASNGLSGMRERVELLGGSFVLETAPGAGVHITAEFPLDVRALPHPQRTHVHASGSAGG